ncbi:MAG: hypothetical protein ACC707_21100 [Thiohalomonadales bacterium]
MLIKQLFFITMLLLPSIVASEPSPEKLTQLLTGKWGVTTVIEGINTYSTTEFKSNHDVYFHLTLSGSDGAYNYKAHGTWRLEGKSVHMEVTFSGSKSYLHVGDKLVYNITHIDTKILSYTDERGGKVTQKRM